MLARTVKAAVVALLAGFFVLLTGVSASAAPATSTAAESNRLSGAASQSVPFSDPRCFSKLGNFRGGTTIIIHTWPGNVRECFGIAPNRAIYHIWKNSSTWVEMPNGGRADDMVAAQLTSDGRFHSVYVHVNGNGDYYSYLTNQWQPWRPV